MSDSDSDSDSDSKSVISLNSIEEVELDVANMAKYDMHNCDIKYSGNPDDGVDNFISRFKTYADLRDYTAPKSILALQTKVYGNARVYLDSIPDTDKDTITKIKDLLKSNFEGSSWKWSVESKLLSRKQLTSETLDDYACEIIRWCKQVGKSEAEKLSIFVRGLLPSVRAFVFSKEPESFKQALDAARLGISVQQTANDSLFAPAQSQNTEPQVNSIHSVLDTLTGVVSNIATRMEKLEHDKHVSFSSPLDRTYNSDSISSSSQPRHQPSQTWNQPRQSQAPYRSYRKLVCNRCGRVGHGWRKCYAKFDVNRNPLN